MAEKVRKSGDNYWFWCPGCQTNHRFDKRWTMTGTLESPSFTPSLLCDFGEGRKCHLFVTNGQIQYCGDSYHNLKNQTVPMEDFNNDFAT
jgi:sugar lactone lactonase YvrE